MLFHDGRFAKDHIPMRLSQAMIIRRAPDELRTVAEAFGPDELRTVAEAFGFSSHRRVFSHIPIEVEPGEVRSGDG